MTKLVEWLAVLTVIVGLWLAITTERNQAERGLMWDKLWTGEADRSSYIALLWPVGLVLLFGLYSVVVIAKRVYDFNDCPEAASELHRQIREAKADLKSKGLNCDADGLNCDAD